MSVYMFPLQRGQPDLACRVHHGLPSGRLPIETIIPAEDWVLKLRYEKADLQGYVTATVLNCPLR